MLDLRLLGLSRSLPVRRLAAAVPLALWISVIACGRLLAYV